MKHVLVGTGLLAAFLMGAILGARYTILNAHVYAEQDAILLEITGEIHEYRD